MSTSFSSIPIIDFSRLQDNATKDEELAILRDAVFNIGFLYLAKTGLEVSNS
jgi:isopenicillin N synthase-like dioxygenase